MSDIFDSDDFCDNTYPSKSQHKRLAAQIQSTQEEKSAAFEWLRSLALQDKDWRFPAILLDELAQAKKQLAVPLIEELEALASNMENAPLSEINWQDAAGILRALARKNAALSNAERDAVLKIDKMCLDNVKHIKKNAANLRQFPNHDNEARARELGAMYVKEISNTLRICFPQYFKE